jgi:competence protein ComGC
MIISLSMISILLVCAIIAVAKQSFKVNISEQSEQSALQTNGIYIRHGMSWNSNFEGVVGHKSIVNTN